jgi:hypothetical protein
MKEVRTGAAAAMSDDQQQSDDLYYSIFTPSRSVM